MKRTNCVNCGAAIDIEATKCPFCGTSYFDLTAVDLCSKEPIALKLRIPGVDGRSAILTQLVVPKFENCSFTIHNENYDVCDMLGRKIASFVQSCSTLTELSFVSVRNPNNGTLYTLEIRE